MQEGVAIPFWINIPFNFKLTDLEAEELPAEIAIRSLSQKLKEDPNDYESLLKRGIEYKTLERYDEALEDFERSITVNPKKNKKN